MTNLPHRNELMAPTVEAVGALGGSGSNEEIVDKVISILQIPENLTSAPYISKKGNADGRTQLEYDLAWCRTYLRQLGGLANSSRGVWALTGIEFNRDSPPPFAPEQTLLPSDWRESVNAYLVDRLTPAAFERLIQRILRETGFAQVEVTGKSGDGGIDGKGIARINGILSFRVVFQCKRYRGAVGLAKSAIFAVLCKVARTKAFS